MTKECHYELGKVIDNQVNDIKLILQQLEVARQELRKSLKKRKDVVNQLNVINYEEFDTQGLFDIRN